jgi:hypothetical protein
MMTSTSSQTDIRTLLGSKPNSEDLKSYIEFLSGNLNAQESANPGVSVFADVVYLNYYYLGLSLMFKAAEGYKFTKGESDFSTLEQEKLSLEQIDIYNVPKPPSPSKDRSQRSAEVAFSSFPLPSLALLVEGTAKSSDGASRTRPGQLDITKTTTGKEFVECLGEPDRKGGGSGPTSGSIGIWCEWTKDGIMVEFGGDKARGPQAWEQGKDAVWKTIQLFPPEY